MSAVGHELWMEMQEKGPFSRAGFARLLTNQWGFPTTHQSISNYLRRERPPAEFISVALDALEADEQRRRKIYEIYFRRTRDGVKDPRITEENRQRAAAFEEEIAREREGDREKDRGPSG